MVVITICFTNRIQHWIKCCLACFITILGRSWHIDFGYRLLGLFYQNIGPRTCVTSRQGMLTPYKHPILHLVYPRARACQTVYKQYKIELDKQLFVVFIFHTLCITLCSDVSMVSLYIWSRHVYQIQMQLD